MQRVKLPLLSINMNLTKQFAQQSKIAKSAILNYPFAPREGKIVNNLFYFCKCIFVLIPQEDYSTSIRL